MKNIPCHILDDNPYKGGWRLVGGWWVVKEVVGTQEVRGLHYHFVLPSAINSVTKNVFF